MEPSTGWLVLPDRWGLNRANIIPQAWPNDGNNKAPKPGHSVSVEDGDNAYLNWLGSKKYLARTKNILSLTPSP